MAATASMLWALLLNGTLLLAGYVAARGLFGQPRGLPRGVSAAVLAWTWCTLGMQVLGAIGALNRETLLAWTLTGLAISGLGSALLPRSETGSASAGVPERWEPAATLALGLVLCAAIRLGVCALLLPVRVVSDGPIYHLYFAARWWKAGRLFPIAAPFGETAATYFPANGDLWFAWLMAGSGGDRLARIGQAPFALLAALAVYGMARRLGAGATAAAIAACWFAAAEPFLLYSFEANVDTIFVAAYLSAAYFALRYALRDGGPATLILAGLAAGLALGTKPTAPVFVPLLMVLIWIVIARQHEQPGYVRLGYISLFTLMLFLPAAYWYGRNIALAGNPLYPLQISAFGRTWLRGWYEPSAMRESQFYLLITAWRELGDIVFMVFDPRLVPVWAAALAGAWAMGRRREPPLDRAVWACSALAAANLALYWTLIPYRTQPRFMLQSVGLAAVSLGRLLDRGRALRWAATGLLAIHLLTPQSWPSELLGEGVWWDLSADVPSPGALIPVPTTGSELARSLTTLQGGVPVAIIVVLALGSWLAARCWAAAAGQPTAGRWTRASLVTALVAAGLGIVVGSSAKSQETFPEFPQYARGWRALEAAQGQRGARIAYAGTNLPFYLMGRNLRNDVRYVNIDAHRDWLLHDYHRAAIAHGERPIWDTPRPGWDRMHPEYPAWLANLRSEQIELLVVAKAKPIDGPFNLADPAGFPVEKVWAELHKETFQPVYGVAESDPEMRIYRVRQARGARGTGGMGS